ncbi:MAG: CoA transferase, partial [Chloroflexi bacterium]|nr:CoA transferase [Chloroflexota bacterium]
HEGSRALELYLDAGKRRVALDYRRAEGAALLGRLATRCDVLLTDLPARDVTGLRLLELGGDAAPAVRTSITPFGLSGPYRDYEATPATLLALGGYAYLMGDAGRVPLTMPGHYAQYQAALFAYTATVAASLDETATRPRVIEVSVLETIATLHQYTTVLQTYGGVVRGRNGNRWSNLHPITILPCADGWLSMAITPNFWEQFTLLIGRPELQEDARFATSPARVEHADELDAIIVASLAGRSREQLFVEGQERWRVPVNPVATVPEVLADRHLAARGFWQQIDQPDGGSVRVPGSPFRFGDEAAPRERPAAVAGADTGVVLETLTGADRSDLDAWDAAGLVGGAAGGSS